MKTKAAVLYALNKPLVIEEIEIPPLTSGQVLVKILFSGLCRSQLNEIKGLKGNDPFLPHLLGHEAFGQIEDVGKRVTKVKRGDRVVISWIKGGGSDVPATRYQLNNTYINSGAVATFSEYAVISENRVTRVNRRMPADVGALLGCALATGMGVIEHTLKVSKNKTVAVFGSGGIGSGAIVGARLAGSSEIIAVDLHQSALTLAKKLGASRTFMSTANTAEEIIAFCGGVDYAVEASGNAHVMEMAFSSLNNSGVLAICGNVHKDKKICVNPFEFIKGKKIIGSWGGHTHPDRDFPKYVKVYLQKKLPLDMLISRKYRLTEINKALDALENNTYPGRLLLDFT